MNKTTRLFALPLLCGLAACAVTPDGSDQQAPADSPVDGTVHVHAKRSHAGDGDGELAPSRNVIGELTNEGTSDPTAIAHHGGSVMHSGVNVYLIWYGNWSGNSATTILTNLVSNIGGSSYYAMNTMYNGGGGYVTSSVTYAGATYDSYSQGSSLGSSGVYNIVAHALDTSALPKDGNGVYFVLTSPDVTESQGTNDGFCSAYCGWHSAGYIGSNDIKYAFVGDPSSQCASSCEAQSTSPNGNAGADGMASVIAHELAETVTDPYGDGWWDSYNGSDYETGDKCAWSFGTTYKESSGAYYNTTLGGSKYLLQMLWVNEFGGYCANEYNAASTLAPNTTLSSNQSVWSADGRFELIMQSDGNLVLYEGSSALWASKTEGKGGTHASMQSDGNLVIYTDSGSAVWASNTNGKSGAGLVVQNDGNVVIYYDGSPIWASGTCCH